MPPITRRQAQRQRESENDDIDNPPATVPTTPVTVPSMPVTVLPTPATPPTTPPSTPAEDSNDESSEESNNENSEEKFREYTPDNMIYIEREPSPTRLLVIERLLVPGVPNLKKSPLCMICLHDFPQPTPDCPHPTVRIPCGHYFCRECITHWLQDPWFDTCPVCRKEVITYQPGTGLPEGEAENDAEQENTAPALTPNQARIAALEQAIFMNNEEIRLYNNYLREAQQAPGTRAPLRDITATGEFHERPNEENRGRVPLGELTNGIPTFSRATTLQDLTTRDAQRAQAIRDADRARANRANRVERMSSLFQASNGGGPVRGRHPLQAVTNASPARSLLDVDEDMPDVQPQQRGRTPYQTTRVRPSTPPPGRSRLFNRSRSPVRNLTNPRTYRSRRAPIQLPQLLRPGQTRALTPSDHGRGDGGRRISIRSSATASSVYTLAPSEPLSTGETVFTLAPEFPQSPPAANDNDAMLRSDVRPSYFDALVPDRFAAGDHDSDSESDDDGSDAETAGRRTPCPTTGSPGVRRLLWSRTSPTPQQRNVSPTHGPNLNATWTPLQGYTTTVHIDVACLRSQRALLLNAIRFAGRGQAEEAFRAMLRVAEASDGRAGVAIDPLFRAMEQAGRDELVALARTQASGVVNRMNSPLRRRRIFEAGGVVGLRPEIVDAVRRLARRMVNLLRG